MPCWVAGTSFNSFKNSKPITTPLEYNSVMPTQHRETQLDGLKRGLSEGYKIFSSKVWLMPLLPVMLAVTLLGCWRYGDYRNDFNVVTAFLYSLIVTVIVGVLGYTALAIWLYRTFST